MFIYMYIACKYALHIDPSCSWVVEFHNARFACYMCLRWNPGQFVTKKPFIYIYIFAREFYRNRAIHILDESYKPIASSCETNRRPFSSSIIQNICIQKKKCWSSRFFCCCWRRRGCGIFFPLAILYIYMNIFIYQFFLASHLRQCPQCVTHMMWTCVSVCVWGPRKQWTHIARTTPRYIYVYIYHSVAHYKTQIHTRHTHTHTHVRPPPPTPLLERGKEDRL